MTAIGSAAAADRWRTGLLLTLLVAQTVIVWEQVPETWRVVAAWLGDAAQRAITHAFWLHLTPVAITVSNLGLAAGAVGALLANTPRASRRRLLGAFSLYLALQVGTRLPPLAWSYAFPPAMQEEGPRILAAAAPLEAVAACLDLGPLLLAVVLGAIRAGRHQANVPRTRATGATVVFLGSLQLALLAAMALAFVAALLPGSWLATGLLLLTVHYGLTTAVWLVLARPGSAGERWLRRALMLSVVGMSLPGWGALLFGLQDVQVLGKHLLAIGGQQGFVPLASLPMLGVLFLARSVATALAANDLLGRSQPDAD